MSPACFFTADPSPPGRFQGRDVTVGDVFEAVGANAAGLMTDAELKQLEDHACPGAGACGGQFTANTMSTVMEFIGLSPMGLNSIPALDPKKDEAAFQCGQIVMDLLKRGVKPLDILTRQAFENAIASVAATGGSTNAVLHLLAMAREANVPLAIEDFDVVSSRTPIIADLKPGGRFVAVDVHHAGGIPLIAKKLLEAGLLDGSQMTPTGKTIAEEAARVTETPGQEVVRPVSNPIKKTGGLVILKGNLAPEGCVIKVAGYERTHHRGPARVFDCEEDAMTRGDEQEHQGRGCGGDSLRRSARRARHAGNAGRHRGAGGRRPGRFGGAAHRRPIQRRNPRPDGGSRGAGSGARRAHRRGGQWRHRRDSTSKNAGSIWKSPTPTSRRAWRSGRPPSRVTSAACSPNMRRWFPPLPKAR